MTEERSAALTQEFGYGVFASLDLTTLAEALAKAQGEIIAAELAGEAKASGAFKGYKYATLAAVWKACREPLAKNGLSVIQLPIADGNSVGVITLLLHTSGQWIKSQLLLPLDKSQRGAQAVGSSTSYARRYAFAAMVGVAVEDDDGEAAVAAAPQQAPRRRRQAQRPIATAKAQESAETAAKTPQMYGEGQATRGQWQQLMQMHTEAETLRQVMAALYRGSETIPPPEALTEEQAMDFIAQSEE